MDNIRKCGRSEAVERDKLLFHLIGDGLCVRVGVGLMAMVMSGIRIRVRVRVRVGLGRLVTVMVNYGRVQVKV